MATLSHFHSPRQRTHSGKRGYVDHKVNGVPLLYFNRGRQDSVWMGDLLVFEGRDGGRAVRVRTVCPGHVAIVIFCSCRRRPDAHFPLPARRVQRAR